MSATTTSNVVTYPVVVTVDNSDGTLLPGLTVNAEIEVSKREGILKVANAALRYKPADNGATAAAPAAGQRSGSGMLDDLARSAAGLGLDDAQQQAFDAAGDAIRQRQAARQAAPRPQGNSMFGGGPRRDGGSGGMPPQVRQRMLERFQQDYAAFRDTLSDSQRKQWDAAVASLVGATRAPVYKLVDGQPQAVMVRIGASDGTATEISGDIQAGDEVVTGERAPAAAD